MQRYLCLLYTSFSDIASTLICHHYHHFLLSHLFYRVNKEYTTVISESYYHISIGELHMITYYKLWDYCNRKDINKTELKEGAGISNATISTVSYTHLDVYKRQSIIRPMAIPATGALIGTPAAISDMVPAQMDAWEEEPLDSVTSATVRIV